MYITNKQLINIRLILISTRIRKLSQVFTCTVFFFCTNENELAKLLVIDNNEIQ